MKTLIDHINEALKIGKDISSFSIHSCQPKTKKELENIIDERISEHGVDCNLNDIDVSQITDMSCLFYHLEFNGDISEWNTSNVEKMNSMFSNSKFTGDISKWDVSKVTNMEYMFYKSQFNNKISDWDVINVKDMWGMFAWSEFNGDISNWNIRKDCDTRTIFTDCSIKNEYKPKLPK